MALKLILVDDHVYSQEHPVCNHCTKPIVRGRKMVQIRNRYGKTCIHDTCFMKFSDEVAKEVGRPVSVERYQMAVSSLERMV